MKQSARLQFIKKAIICSALCVSLSGCAGTIIAGLTISELLTAGSIGSSLLTGKGLGEHAMDAMTGQDCRILEAVFREDRAICEPHESVATKDDFKGLVALLDTPAGEQIQIADLPPIGHDQFSTVKSTVNTDSDVGFNPITKAASHKVLATLTHKNIQHPTAQAPLRFTDLSHLTKVTKDFDPKTINVKAVDTSDLKKRLMGGRY